MPAVSNRRKLSGTRISSATTTLVKTGPGLFARVIIDTPVTTNTFTVYDALTATGTPISIITVSGAVPVTLDFDIPFQTGLCVVSSGTSGAVFAFQ